jgi:putative two-component system response regulator
MDYIREQSGKHFDPTLVAVLEQELDKMLEIKAKWPEDDE